MTRTVQSSFPALIKKTKDENAAELFSYGSKDRIPEVNDNIRLLASLYDHMHELSAMLARLDAVLSVHYMKLSAWQNFSHKREGKDEA